MKFALGLVAAALLEAQPVRMPFEAARPILESAGALPAALAPLTGAAFARWQLAADKTLESRLARGDADSLVHFLLFGTSYTHQPRIEFAALAEATRAGTLRARMDDLLGGLASPGDNERLRLFAEVLRAQGLQPANRDGKAGVFLLENLQRVLRENAAYAERSAAASAFEARGVSLDAGIYPNYAIEQAFAALHAQGRLRMVNAVAVVGPGLDLVDKNSGHDFYPVQTLQPFAVQEALVRNGVSQAAPRLVVLDGSSRVVNHVERARRSRARYALQLTQPSNAAWLPGLSGYWSNFGNTLGAPLPNPVTPPNAGPVETRRVSVKPDVAAQWSAQRLNIITERVPARFPLIVITNLLVYYSPLEQQLSLANLAAMLAPGGLLVTNDAPALHAAIPLRHVLTVPVSYTPVLNDVVTVYERLPD